MIKAALFDLDGVVLDTETQYTEFWGMIGREYHPEIPDFCKQIKGQTLVQIYDAFFQELQDEQAEITRRLDEFERNMQYNYIAGFEAFVQDLRRNGIKCAVVTSSNVVKMRAVYDKHPELAGYFDKVLTSEDFAASKPHPDCYLKGAAVFQAKPVECVGFEDSFNGLKAVRAAGEFTMGLATTNSREAIASFCDHILDDYQGFTFAELSRIVAESHK